MLGSYSRRCVNSFLLSYTLLFSPVPAKAAGFYLQEQSVSSLGSANAGSVANPQDPSTVFYNPAGMTQLRGIQLNAGSSVLFPKTTLTNRGSTLAGAPIGLTPFGSSGDGGNPYKTTPLPQAYATMQLTDNLWAGLSFTAPFGLGEKYNNNYFARYDSTNTRLEVFDFQPSLAYKINDMFSIGGGVNIQRADAKLESAVTNGAAQGSSKLEGKDWDTGYTIGVQARPLPGTTLGINYHSPVTHTLKGRIVVTGAPGLNTDVPGRADLDLPDQVAFGAAQKIGERWTIEGQATFFGWSRFNEIRARTNSGAVAQVVPQNFRDTMSYALGAEYAASDQWVLRSGIQFDETPTQDAYRTTRIPDGNRTWLAAGATYKLNPNIDLNAALAYVRIADQDINVTRNGGLAVVRAGTSGDVAIAGLSATYKFNTGPLLRRHGAQ